ncbi:NAD(P)H-dependent oxidoreductase [Rhizobacter sp. AJA081-3]|uniref:NAD(P)H-dependent oxidoreductase n=1 Tax=Rhizobacter sp. AJA081-3 TaxID=2753607 RepID=UPI001ADFC44F|nr:NAD(P)H-dependent oxidoreductase [Rhizobacter sp. AJA081-3]QTN25548.1 NAD(P)H-dependent oxidoreductase [Rhizobacter sp. AJA081-3]
MAENRRILIIQGHPDVTEDHLGHALAHAYAGAATAAGHQVRTATPAQLDFPLLRSQKEWEHGALPLALQKAQDDIAWAQHLLLFFPLWMGDMPALLKGFLEQVARPGFAFRREAGSPFGQKGLAGRSARVVVTMGMPALVYRFYFRAHSVKSLERNILGFVGISPVHETLIGQVDTLDEAGRAKWLATMARLGRTAA